MGSKFLYTKAKYIISLKIFVPIVFLLSCLLRDAPSLHEKTVVDNFQGKYVCCCNMGSHQKEVIMPFHLKEGW